jgi:hypothetical protein
MGRTRNYASTFNLPVIAEPISSPGRRSQRPARISNLLALLATASRVVITRV